MQETTHISYELLTLFLMAGFCGSGVGARGMRSTSDNDTQDPIALWKGLPACVLLRGNIIWSSWQMLPDLMLKYQGKRARREKIELKKKKQAERRGESASAGGKAVSGRGVSWVYPNRTTRPFFKLNWTLNHFGGGKYDTVLFLSSSNASAHER